jgi:hypothetical protein
MRILSRILDREHVVGGKPARGSLSEISGAVLLEVILALALFVAAAAVLTSGLSSSLDGIERLRRNTRAADLAVSVLSELQMGIKTLALTGPQPFEPVQDGWTWEILSTPLQAGAEEIGPYKMIEVVIRHEEPPLVYRLGQVLQVDDAKAGAEGGSGGENPY